MSLSEHLGKTALTPGSHRPLNRISIFSFGLLYIKLYSSYITNNNIYEVLPTKNPHVLLPTSSLGCVQPEMGKSMGMISSISCFVSWKWGPPDHRWMRTSSTGGSPDFGKLHKDHQFLVGKFWEGLFSGFTFLKSHFQIPMDFYGSSHGRIPRSKGNRSIHRMLAVDSIWSPRTWLHSTSCTNSKKNTASSAYGSRSLTTIKNLFFWVEEHQEKTIAIYRHYIGWYIRHHILS